MKNNKYFPLVRRHRKFDEKLYRKVMRQPPALVANLATPEAKKLYRMSRNVTGLLHLKKGFMRFQVHPKGILYTQTTLEHDVMDLLLAHFHMRYPTFQIAIEVKDKTYTIDERGVNKTYPMRLSETITHLEVLRPLHEMAQSMGDTKGVWESFYQSQYISQRKNLKLQQKMMPHKYRDRNNVIENTDLGNTKLTNFLG